MSTNKNSKNVFQRVIHYISNGAIRLFSPSDDNYPATGVQPFKGDPADKKSR